MESRVPDTFNLKLFQLWNLWSARPMYLVPNKSTIDELKSTGLLSHIKNAELKGHINKYYNELEWQYSQVRESQQSDQTLSWLSLLRKYGLNNESSLTLNDIDKIRTNDEISRFMSDIMSSAKTRMNIAGSNKRDALRLIQATKKELGEVHTH